MNAALASLLLAAGALAAAPGVSGGLVVLAQEVDVPEDIVLPAARTTGGMPLMDALAARRSTRDVSDRPLPPQVLSDMLWAAWGVNRDDGRRTAPSARNWQEIDVYVVMESGTYLYDAAAHILRGVSRDDLRAVTGAQAFVATAPLNLVYVADTERMRGVPAGLVDAYAWADASFISQNVYLFCASEGLATVVRAMVDRPAVARALGLPETRMVVMAQSVGYPASPD